MEFQQRMWLFERVAWVLLFLILIAAVLGLFSRGPLSTTAAQDAGGDLTVEYQRFERSDAATDFVIRLQPRSSADSISLTYSSDFLRGFTITDVHPAPIESRGGPDGLTQRFYSPGQPFRIHLAARPRGAGLVHSRLGIVGGPAVELVQFIYP